MQIFLANVSILQNLRQTHLFGSGLASIRPTVVGPGTIRIAGTSAARMQLRAFRLRMRLAHAQMFDRSHGRGIGVVPANLMSTTLATPNALVRRLHARRAISR